ncbi:lipopolysaccharide export system permease protein [Apibacter mensalis]|uniref:Lipopolysaccharide export system permease protein n=1 Tax=Apibacter mensalis TaxID=1586267 RepID=A0A0X3ARM5_9FLAO|nr:LptF/LptG family permease [Apibacter mensalis]CVK16893.1 lipopolysaccharide export system permease protein [Apibacter mensalis]
MIKKLDWYIIRTFFGPFLFIFSVLMFIFVVQFAFNQMDKFLGKGLNLWDISKLLYYLGLDVIRLVLPLTILLSSIMTFGGFGERYELAAMKSAGISLARIMYPLFSLVVLLAVWLFYFCNTTLPENQRRARNMLINIAQTRPALNFEEGRFIKEMNPLSIKIGKKSGENGSEWDQVFIHKNASSFEDQQTIIADKGNIISKDNHYLKIELYNGYIYQDNIKGKNLNELKKQPGNSIKFDTLTQYYDISDLIKKSLDKQSEGDNFRYKSVSELSTYIDSIKTSNTIYFKELGTNSLNILLGETNQLDSLDYSQYNEVYPFEWSNLDDNAKYNLVKAAINQVNVSKNDLGSKNTEMKAVEKFIAKMILWQQKNIISYAITSVVFFLIGAPLGSIIRKGGVGLPVVVAIIIFIIFYILGLYMENLAKNQVINAYWASWIPNAIFLPVGIFLTIKSMRDSELFDVDNYLKPFKRFISKFIKPKNLEHSRYQ